MTDWWRLASSALFLAQGAFYFLIGALTPFFLNRVDDTLFFTARSDSGYFGGDTGDLQDRDPNLAKLRNLLLLAIAGLLVALGTAIAAIAWFAVRPGEAWGLWSLVVTGALALAFWLLITGKYVRAGAPLGLVDIPPFMWVTTLLWAVASICGVVGRRTGG